MLRLNSRARVLSTAAVICAVFALAGPANAAQPTTDPTAPTDTQSVLADTTSTTSDTPTAADTTPATLDPTPAPDVSPTPDATPTDDPTVDPDATPTPTDPTTDGPSKDVTPTPSKVKAPAPAVNATYTLGNQTSTVGELITPVSLGTCPGDSCIFSAPALPAGLSLDAATGEVTGTPTKAVTATVAVAMNWTITNPASSGTDNATFTWTVNDVVSVSDPGDATSVVGDSTGFPTATASQRDMTNMLTWSASGLPEGVSIDPSTGAFTGILTKAQTVSYTITVTAAHGESATSSFIVWRVNDTVTLHPMDDQFDFTTEEVSNWVDPVTVTQADPTNTLTYKATGLPDGVSLDSATGEFSGVAAAPGDYGVLVTVTAAHGEMDWAEFTWSVRDEVRVHLNPIADQSSVVGQDADVWVDADLEFFDVDTMTYVDYADLPEMDNPPYDAVPGQWTISFNGLPPGMYFYGDGMSFVGTPNTVGTYETSVKVCVPTRYSAMDQVCDATAFTWTVTAPPVVKTISLEKPTVLTPPPPKVLAETGSSSGDPLLIAFGLVGLGGCALIARKRLLASGR